MDPQINCRIFALPAELRNQIYRQVLVEDQITMTPEGAAPLTPPPTLLQTCRRIREEAASIYFEENTFAFYVTSLDVCRVTEWADLSEQHAQANQILAFVSQPNWANLLHWLELFYKDECAGFEEPDADRLEQHPEGAIVHHAFTMVGQLKEEPGMTWEKVRQLLESVHVCIKSAKASSSVWT